MSATAQGADGLDPVEAVGAASAWSRMTRAEVDPDAVGDPTRARYAATDLADPRMGVAARVAHEHAATLGVAPGRRVASLVFQRYAHRVCLLAVTTFALGGRALDVRADAVVAEFAEGLPARLLLPRPAWLGASGDDGLGLLLEAVIEGHLLPVGLAFRDAAGVGVPHLWGNLAASFALAVRVVARHRGVDAARALGETIAAARPGLARGGAYRELERDGHRDLFYDRASCCLWFDLPGGRYCTACSRLTHDERTRRFTRSLTHGAAP